MRGCNLCNGNPYAVIDTVVALNRAGRFPVERIVTEYAFEDINSAILDLEIGRVVKPILLLA